MLLCKDSLDKMLLRFILLYSFSSHFSGVYSVCWDSSNSSSCSSSFSSFSVIFKFMLLYIPFSFVCTEVCLLIYFYGKLARERRTASFAMVGNFKLDFFWRMLILLSCPIGCLTGEMFSSISLGSFSLSGVVLFEYFLVSNLVMA